MLSKKCFKCGETKPISEFYQHVRMADGHLNKCKSCTKKDVNEHRQANIERIRQYDRERGALPHRLALSSAIHQRYIKQYPERRAAHLAVQYALKRGDLEKQPCLVCGESKAEAHHPDYENPLGVVWLCAVHHRAAHMAVEAA